MSQAETKCRCGHVRRHHAHLEAAVADDFLHAGPCDGSGCGCLRFVALADLTSPLRAYVGMAYARHVACGTELEWRQRADYPQSPGLGLWCQSCGLFVQPADVTTRHLKAVAERRRA